MPAAPKPSPGTPVESTWGGQVHDSSVSAIGVVARADPTTAGDAAALIFVEGVASMLNGTDIVIPVAGVYHVEAILNAAGGGEGGAYRGFLNKNGVDTTGMGFPTKSGSNIRGVCSWDGMCNAGDRWHLSWGLVGGSGTPSWTIQRISARLVAQAWAT